MVKELQALCLDIRVLDENGESVDISGVVDDDAPNFNNIEEVERSVDAEAEGQVSDDEDDFDEEFDDDGELYDDEEFDDEFDDDFADDEE
jgi:DNA-directed RNA polymerase subunit beta